MILDTLTNLNDLEKQMVGKKVINIHLIVFLIRNMIEMKDPILQIILEKNLVMRFEGINGGEKMAYYNELWKSDEFEKYDDPFGILVKADISKFSPYDLLIKQQILGVGPLFNNIGQIAGLQIFFANNNILSYLTSADENYLFFNDYGNKIKAMGFTFKHG